ncbi:MAG: choice-of-anchor Q domain-containing protein, partial [Phycisphaerales bacterium]
FATIQKGIDAAPDGSTVLVAPGSYEENIIMKERVHLRGSGPSVTFISGEGKQLRSTLLLWAVIWAADHSVLEGFTITVTPPDDSYNRYAVQGYTEDRNDPIIANNVFMGGSGNELISFWGGSARIVNNTFFGNQFQHSLISVNNHLRSGIPVVANNIFANNQIRSVVGAHNGAQPEVSFNMLWDNSVRFEDFVGFTPGLGNRWENPCFIDPASGDLRLSPSSPAIDAGDNDSILPFLPTDMPGDSRIVNGTIDMGAYESGTAPTPNVYYADAVNGDDNNDGLTPQAAFATIQRGIDAAEDGEVVLVCPGVYQEEVNFLGKALTVQGVAPSPAGVPVLQNPGDFAVSFYYGEGRDSILKNFVIRNSFIAVFIARSSPTISNVTIVENRYGIDAYAGSEPDISNVILWNNAGSDLFGCQARYSCIEQVTVGEGNIDADPLFVDPVAGDYRLASQRGRYWPEHDVWVLDKVTSPCVDGGDPGADPLREPTPNGSRINMGAYGGTPQASLSLRCEPLPGRASNPSPADGAVGVSTDVILSWTAGSNAVSHDVYFGTYDSLAFVGNQTATEFNPGKLNTYTTYFWRIDEVNSEGTTTGEIWTFTPGPPRPPKGRTCFTGETGVWVNGTLVPISNVGLGQNVGRTDSASAGGSSVPLPHLGKVEELQEHEGTFVCYDVLLESGNCISVAENHYFLAESGRWISLQELKAGTKLQTARGSIGIISMTWRPTPYAGKVYNLKVEGSDRYLVGADAVIVRDY